MTAVSKSCGDREHRAEARHRLVIEPLDPARDLRVRLRALQKGVAPDELDLVEEQNPPCVAGGHHELGGEAKPLEREVSRSHLRERERRAFARLSQLAS